MEYALESLKIAVLHIRENREHAIKFQQELDELNANTLQEIVSLGHRPELIASSKLSLEQIQQCVDQADAVVIMGGEDVDPELYDGLRIYPGSGTHEPTADRMQIAAIHHAISTQTPLLGICRGLQLVNVALGGTLIQHMENSDSHRAIAADPFVHTNLGFVSEDMAGDVQLNQVNRCTHHQAIHSLGAGLRITAISTDDVIEAVVHDSAPLTAVQWHPEHHETSGSQLRALLSRLVRQRVNTAVSV